MYKPGEAKQALKDAIRGYLLKDENGKYVYSEVNRIPIYFEGAPGIGKTEIVKQVAEEMGMGFVSSSLTHHTRQSVLGLPVIQELEDYGKYTQYTMSEILGMVYQKQQQGYDEGILLLDEFPCVSESILPIMLAFLQTKNIGQHYLPEGWTIVLCGNPPDYNKSARSFDAAITDRMRKIQMEFSVEDFLNYARQHDFHETIISYLEANKAHVYICENKKDGDLVTCRGWENLSHGLKAYEKLGQRVDEKFISQFIKSEKVVYEFYKLYAMTRGGCTLEDMENIMQGKRLEEYANKWKKMEFVALWNIVDLLGGQIRRKAESKNERDTANEAVTHVFRFLSCFEEQGQLSEHFYQYITGCKSLMELMAECRNEAYCAASKKAYPKMA
jgi:hypothetical protein